MQYTKLEVTRVAVYEEVLRYLRETTVGLAFQAPNMGLGPLVEELTWFDGAQKTGRRVTDIVNEVYGRLLSTGRIQQTTVSVMSSSEMHLGGSYYPALIKTIIFEEIAKLIRAGALLEARFTHPDQPNFDIVLQPNKEWVVLTGLGVRLLASQEALLYEAEPYVDRLRQIAEPDDELVAYLGEGLACLQYSLARAAAVLLRLCIEHILGRIIDAMLQKFPDEPSKQKFQGKINQARGNIEQRAETCFVTLGSGSLFIANEAVLKTQLDLQLRPAFHAIRELGGDAAHPKIAIDVEQVRHHYYMFAETIYPISIKFIQHLRQP